MHAHNPVVRGLATMLGASVLLAVMGAATKYASTGLTFWETTFWRCFLTLALVAVMLWRRGRGIPLTGDHGISRPCRRDHPPDGSGGPLSPACRR